jgi:hypothetical protein
VFALQARSTSAEITRGRHSAAEVDALDARYHQKATRAGALFATAAAFGAGATALWVLRF